MCSKSRGNDWWWWYFLFLPFETDDLRFGHLFLWFVFHFILAKIRFLLNIWLMFDEQTQVKHTFMRSIVICADASKPDALPFYYFFLLVSFSLILSENKIGKKRKKEWVNWFPSSSAIKQSTNIFQIYVLLFAQNSLATLLVRHLMCSLSNYSAFKTEKYTYFWPENCICLVDIWMLDDSWLRGDLGSCLLVKHFCMKIDLCVKLFVMWFLDWPNFCRNDFDSFRMLSNAFSIVW